MENNGKYSPLIGVNKWRKSFRFSRLAASDPVSFLAGIWSRVYHSASIVALFLCAMTKISQTGLQAREENQGLAILPVTVISIDLSVTLWNNGVHDYRYPPEKAA